jgi:hypothetical protein
MRDASRAGAQRRRALALALLGPCAALGLACATASPATRDVPQYRSAQPLTPLGLGAVSVEGGGGTDREALQLTLDKVLRGSNFFDRSAAAGAARVHAKILEYSQPPASFGDFTTTLRVHYTVTAPDGVALYDQEILAKGADDTGAYAGLTRAARAKTLALASNVADFRNELEAALEQHSRREYPGYLAAAATPAAAATSTTRFTPPAPQLEGEVLVPLSPAELEAAGPFEPGAYHALVIGNDHYEQLPQLHTAVNDARAVGELLGRSYGFEVTLLVDASRSDILGALAQLRHELSESDNLLIYYAGHGWFDTGTRRGYWLPVDATEQDPSNWVSAADVTDILRAMRARHVLVVADSCYSGSLTRGLAIVNRDRDYIRRLASKRARVVLTSGGLEPVEDEGGAGHSVFARAFLDTLESNDGVLEGTALFNALRRPVVLHADQTPEYGDIRFAGHEGGDFLFIRKR